MSGRVVNFEVQVERFVGVGVDVDLQIVVAGPVLHAVERDITPVDPQGLRAIRSVLSDYLPATQRILVFEGRNQLHVRAGRRRGWGVERHTATHDHHRGKQATHGVHSHLLGSTRIILPETRGLHDNAST